MLSLPPPLSPFSQKDLTKEGKKSFKGTEDREFRPFLFHHSSHPGSHSNEPFILFKQFYNLILSL
jgi:hypothetical protein